MLTAALQPGWGWRRRLAILGLAVLAAIGSLFFLSGVKDEGGFGCWDWGRDFIAFYASGRMVLQGDGAHIYDPAWQERIQSHLSAEVGSHCYTKAMPMEYFAAAMLPYLPVVVASPGTAFLLWSMVNVALVGLGLRRIATFVRIPTWPLWLWAFGSPLVYVGLVVGQVHAWLFLAMVEVVVALHHGQERRAGIWLSLLMIKPQFLPLYLAALALKRRWRALAGFVVGAALFLGISVLMVGPSAITQQVALIFNFVAGHDIAAKTVQSSAIVMVNWHAVLASLLTVRDLWWWSTLVFAAVATSFTALRPWAGDGWHTLTSSQFSGRLVGLTAAALLVAYDTHIHSVLLLAAPGLFLIGHKATSVRTSPWITTCVEVALLVPGVLSALVWAITQNPGLVVVGLGTTQVLIVLLVGMCVAVAFARPVPTSVQDREVTGGWYPLSTRA